MRFKENIEPQEVLLDSLAQKKEEEFGVSGKKFEVPLSRRILEGFFILSLILILFLFAKTFQLQIIEGKDLLALSEENKFIISQIQAERGVIYDRNFHQLIFNRPAFDLILNKLNLPEVESERTKVLKTVSQILNNDFVDLKSKIENSEGSLVLISENIPHETLIILETKIRELPGFEIRRDWVREYKDGADFSHLIGYLGKITASELKDLPDYSIFDWIGKDGLEKSYEEILKKDSGKIRIERDALGREISREIIKLPQSGKSLVLWLDSDLQKKIKEVLEQEIKIVGSKNGVAVALDPKSGGVLALVSLPDFGNNLFNKGVDQKNIQNLLNDPSEPLFNRVISGKYLTGSTIKPLIASAALEERIINPQKDINCQGAITIPNPWEPSLPTIKKDWTIHGWTDMRKAIAESCNVYFYTIGGGYEDQRGLGPTRIKEYLEIYGWGEKTGIDLPGETAGFIPDKEWKKETWGQGWWDGDTYNLSIGQGFLQITPLEVVTAFSAIANGGKLLQPQVVKNIVDSEKNIIQNFEPKIIRENFINPENLQIVREGMRQAVTGINSPLASAFDLNSLPVSAAAKTGTAELGKDYYHNWITVFAPYEDPEIVLTIVIENVKGVQTAALPVAKEVLQWYFSNKY